ncbi:hypothetical protein JYB64_13385 [Algoriphagus aestuarii]|nr:hypothetical protein [Algoriphagus aestuarii]
MNGLVNDRLEITDNLNEILNPEGFGFENVGGVFKVQGGVVHKIEPVINEAHFRDIQNRILKALDNAEVSTIVVMAWFTNNTLFEKLVEKHIQGLCVRLAKYDDGINKKYGVDISRLPHKKIKRGQ